METNNHIFPGYASDIQPRIKAGYGIKIEDDTVSVDGDIGSGITVVDNFSDLPDDAETGATAIVLYDDAQETPLPLDGTAEIPAGTTVTPSETIQYSEDAYDALVQACVDSGSGVFAASVLISSGREHDPSLSVECSPLDVHEITAEGLELEQTLYVRAANATQKYAITAVCFPGGDPSGAVDVGAVYLFADAPGARIYANGLIGYLEQDLQAGWSVVTAEFTGDGEIVGLSSMRHVDHIGEVFSIETPGVYAVQTSDYAAGVLYGTVSAVTSVPRRGLYVKQADGWSLVDDYAVQIAALQQVTHWHDNLSTLGKLGENDSGNLTFDGAVVGGSSDTLVPLTLGTEYDLQIRDDWTDVPIYLTTEESYRIGLQTSADSTEDLIRMYEASDFSTGLPCPMLRVKRGENWYTYIPRAFTSISQSYNSGWYDAEDNPVDAPSLAGMTFGAFDVGGTKYTDLTDLPEKARLALETLSRIFNVSTDAMGSLGAIEDGVQRFQGEIAVNRKYAFSPADIAVLTLPTVPWTAEDAQFVIYLHCANNSDVTFPSGTLFVGGDAPNTEAGEHKLIGSWLRDAQAWAIGGVDYAGVT